MVWGVIASSLMPTRVDLELARLHLHQVEETIAGQLTRIEQLKSAKESTQSAVDFLDVMTQTRERLMAFIERTSWPVN